MFTITSDGTSTLVKSAAVFSQSVSFDTALDPSVAKLRFTVNSNGKNEYDHCWLRHPCLQCDSSPPPPPPTPPISDLRDFCFADESMHPHISKDGAYLISAADAGLVDKAKAPIMAALEGKGGGKGGRFQGKCANLAGADAAVAAAADALGA